MRCNARKRILIVLRSVLTITCVAIFFVISGGLVRNYIHGKVIVSSSDTPIGSELVQAPLIALCSRKGFEDVEKPMLNISDYMMNSINVTEGLTDVTIRRKGLMVLECNSKASIFNCN